jgi:hypothetical protein
MHCWRCCIKLWDSRVRGWQAPCMPAVDVAVLPVDGPVATKPGPQHMQLNRI